MHLCIQQRVQMPIVRTTAKCYLQAVNQANIDLDRRVTEEDQALASCWIDEDCVAATGCKQHGMTGAVADGSRNMMFGPGPCKCQLECK